MKFKIKFTFFIKNQLEELHIKTRKSLVSKIQLLKENPFRNKSLISHKHLFRIRFVDINIDINFEKRLIYVVRGEEVKLLFILNRKKNYKDLENYMKKIKEEFKEK